MALQLRRRGFLRVLAGLVAAPAVVKAESLMRISAPVEPLRAKAKLWIVDITCEGSIEGFQGDKVWFDDIEFTLSQVWDAHKVPNVEYVSVFFGELYT
jgi:hypothetical protein